MDTEGVKKLAHLARISVSEEELQGFAADIGNILGFIDRVRAVELDGESSRDIERVNVFRDDAVAPLPPAYDLVECAPLHKDHFVQVPKVIE
jgi:aspartyl-tRNA(Asn)/glutamyl-tRNA(Gln) amidotransferase subunit C